MKNKKIKKLIITLSIICSTIILLVGSFFIYTSIYYHADQIALNVYKQTNVEDKNNLTIIYPEEESETAIIFYPGAKVEAISYLPLLDKLADNGYLCILIHMPFNLAIFNSNAADQVFDQYQSIKNWYLCGHSMGGAMASSYDSKNPDKLNGLILLGAYNYKNYQPSDTLTIYGSLNQSVEDQIDYQENVVEIEGGNHAQFGNYGFQKGDKVATISSDEQQNQTVQAIIPFIESHNIN